MDDVVHLIALILKKDNFSFNGENYLAKHGTAIGTQMAPSFANIFMGKLEKNLLPQATHKPTILWRYIDDINTYHATIKFNAKWSWESITFLDTKIVHDGNHLVTDPHTKPTDTRQYHHR